MGVDLETYRGRIGTYRHSCGQDVITVTCVINFSSSLKTTGAVLFIGVLLLIAGIESNPGPEGTYSSFLFTVIVVVIIGFLVQILEWKIPVFYLMCLLLVGGLFCYGTEQATYKETKDKDSSNSDNEEIPQVPPPADPELHLSMSRVVNTSLEQSEASNNSENEGTQQVRSPAVPALHQSAPSVVKTSHKHCKEEENFLRMTLLILKCGMPLLRRFISHKAHEDGKAIDAILQRNKPKILRQLHKELKETVFPQNGKTDLELWDFSTMTVVLLEAFKPSLKDKTDEKNAIKTIKNIRDNVFAHSKTLLLRDDCYERHSTDLKQAFETLLNKLHILEQNRFKTILNECEKGQIGEKQSIIQTIESQFQQLRADMTKTIRDEYKKSVAEGKLMKECKVVETDITISGGKEDESMIELVQKTILQIFSKAVERCGTSEFSSLEKAVQGIVDGINDLGNAKVISAISGSIILKIEVYTNKALLDTLKYVDSESMNKKLEAVTYELMKSKQLQPSCSLSAAVSERTLWTLYSECNYAASQREDNKSQLEVSPTTALSLHQSESSNSENGKPLPEQHEVEGEKEKSIEQPISTFKHTATNVGEGSVEGNTEVKQMATYTSNLYQQPIPALKPTVTNFGEKSVEGNTEGEKQTSTMQPIPTPKPTITNVGKRSDEGNTEGGEKQKSTKQPISTSKPTITNVGKRSVEGNTEGEKQTSTMQPIPTPKSTITNVGKRSDEGNTEGEKKTSTKQPISTSKPTITNVSEKSLEGNTEENITKQYHSFQDLMEKFQLKRYESNKISVREIITIDIHENETPKQASMADIPWILLKRLTSVNSDARDRTISFAAPRKTASETSFFQNPLPFLHRSNKDCMPSSLDTFIVVFQCCDHMLRKILVQKLYLCKMAIPFLYIQFDKTNQKPVLSIWPLRSLMLENKASASKSSNFEVEVLDLKSKVVSFARFGRPKFSKSKLLNGILSEQTCNTFFNKDCFTGTAPRLVSDGLVEMFWLPTMGTKKDRFKDALTFLNIRGSIDTSIHSKTIAVIKEVSDVLVLIIDIDDFVKFQSGTENILRHFKNVIFVIASPLDETNIDCLKYFDNKLKKTYAIQLDIVCTFDELGEKNIVDMVSSFTEIISKRLHSLQVKPFEERLQNLVGEVVGISSDEETDFFSKCKKIATDIFKKIKSSGLPKDWKKTVTPIQYEYIPKLGLLFKQLYREKDQDQVIHLQENIKKIRQKQLNCVSTPIKYFLKCITGGKIKTVSEMQLMLSWLKLLIDSNKRSILPALIEANRSAWENLRELNARENIPRTKLKQEEEMVIHTENEIEKVSFGTEHLFREIGYIYDSVVVLKSKCSNLEIPETKEAAQIVTNLFTDGHTLELIDGESVYMPYEWLKLVLTTVSENIQYKKVMTLSALGLQSSGKSTLLNTMFGLQFTTSSGRCTKGIHIHLVPLKTSNISPSSLKFEYVLVVDTEGLRAPELSGGTRDHDNQLATIITGLGDCTMLNIMGENMSEMNDVLQVIVHAFLRLNVANKTLDIKKNCVFLHQNVADVFAPEKMKTGLRSLMKTLDKATIDSAKVLGKSNITQFTHVIEFDMSKHVWYLPNLWQGNPPMAVVNSEYSERAVDIKCKLFDIVISRTDKSFKSLTDIIAHTYDLWKGVLSEDFVFSFRNSLEIKAYIQLEQTVQTHKSNLENKSFERCLQICHKEFLKCENEKALDSASENVKLEIGEIVSEGKDQLRTILEGYFDENEYKDTIENWKQHTMNRLSNACRDLEENLYKEIKRMRERRQVDILTNENQSVHEDKIYQESLTLAKSLKGQNLSQDEIERRFESIWKTFPSPVSCHTQEGQSSSLMQAYFKTCLNEIFSQCKSILKKNMEIQFSTKPQINTLKNSYSLMGIEKGDINLEKCLKVFIYDKKGKLDQVKDYIEQLFQHIEMEIEHVCQTDDEITQQNVKMFLQNVYKTWSENENRSKFTKNFEIKFMVHISVFSHYQFQHHNTTYKETRSTDARVKQYKEKIKRTFYAFVNDRKAEDTAANLLCHSIENVVRDAVHDRLPTRVKSSLLSHIPCLKYNLMIEIVSDLINKDDFMSFVRYNSGPKLYAEEWITAKAKNHLFGTASRQYFALACNLISELLNDIRTGIKDSANDFKDKCPSFKQWKQAFSQSLKQCTVPEDGFRDARRVLGEKLNKDNFLTNLLEELHEVEIKLRDEFGTVSGGTVKWRGFHPFEYVIETVWGCPDQCPFCGEPCAKDSFHVGSNNHYCIQHKPSGCIGVRDTDTKAVFLTSCNFDVNTYDMKHKCNVFNFICNPGVKKECSEKWHKYREYRKYFPNWDIAPTANMNDRSKLWMWFMAQYKQQLGEYYSMDVSNIPQIWNDITKDDAFNSFRETYAGDTI